MGSMVQETIQAVEQFDLNGLKPRVVNARFVKPLDERMLDEISERFSAVVTIEEGSLEGGFGTAVLTALSDRGFDGSVQRCGIPDSFVEHGDRTRLLLELGLTSDKIAESLSRLTLSGAAVH